MQAERAALLAKLSAADVLPTIRVSGGAPQPLVTDTDCYVQPKNSSLTLQLTTITAIDLASGRADLQVAYLPEPEPFGPAMPHGVADGGVSEILLRDERHVWVLERAWSLATGVSVRLYEADLDGASDTLGVGTLRPGRYRPAPKRLLLAFRASGLPHIDNFEAMAWGPPLPNGHRTLVLCTDDNFNPLQVTQFVVFEVTTP